MNDKKEIYWCLFDKSWRYSSTIYFRRKDAVEQRDRLLYLQDAKWTIKRVKLVDVKGKK